LPRLVTNPSIEAGQQNRCVAQSAKATVQKIVDNMSMNTQSYVSDELTHFVGKAEKLPDGKPDNVKRYASF